MNLDIMEKDIRGKEVMEKDGKNGKDNHELIAKSYYVKDLNREFYYDCKLGEGSYGQVTLYKSDRNNPEEMGKIESVAVKRSQTEINFSNLRESVYLKKLNRGQHPNILKLYEVGIDDKGIYLIFEKHQMTLHDYLVKFDGDREENRNISYQLISGVSYIHQSGLIHRDIKPENIMISKKEEKNHLTIIDYGLMRNNDHNRNNQMMTGVVCAIWYRPPESVFESSIHDDKVDAWSVGCVLYEIFFRSHFFTSKNIDHMLIDLIKTFGPFPREIFPYSINEELWKQYQTYISIYLNSEHQTNTRIDPFNLCDYQHAVFFKKINPIDWMNDNFAIIDLIKKLLTPNPLTRISVTESLRDRFFDSPNSKINSKNDPKYDPKNDPKNDPKYDIYQLIPETEHLLMRKSCLEWMQEVCTYYGCSIKTYFFVIYLLDRYWIEYPTEINSKNMQVASAACLHLGINLYEIYQINYSEITLFGDLETVTKENIFSWEKKILTAFQFDLEESTVYDFILANSDISNPITLFTDISSYNDFETISTSPKLKKSEKSKSSFYLTIEISKTPIFFGYPHLSLAKIIVDEINNPTKLSSVLNQLTLNS